MESVSLPQTDQEKKYHASYMRWWRRQHPEYREKQKATIKQWLEQHPDYLYEYNKKWRLNHPDKIRLQHLHYRQRHPEKIAMKRAEYAKRHPDRKSARRKALRLNFNTCSSCGSIGKIERHHPDYSQPFKIVPLCHECHVKEHRKLRLLVEA